MYHDDYFSGLCGKTNEGKNDTFFQKKENQHLLGDFLVIPFFVEFKIEPSRLKLDWRAIFMEFFGGNGGGDGSLRCSIGLCLPQRPIIIVEFFFRT